MSRNDTLALNGRTIRCILFDCGNTLWTFKDKTTWQHLESSANQRAITLLRQHLPQHNLPLTDDEKLAHQLRETIDELLKKAKQERPDDEPNSTLVTLEALIQLGFPRLDNASGEAIFEALRIPCAESRSLFADALTTLATLQERGFILGVVTNRSWGGQPFVEDMRILGLLDYFDPDCMAVSAYLGIRKPNPAIFMHALNALRVAPTEAAMVGDALRADIVGASQLNIFTVWKPGPPLVIAAKAAPSADKPDNNYLLSYAYQQGELQNRPLLPSAQPDLTVEQLSDLLDVFLKVGAQ